MKRWYAVFSKPRLERVAEEQLRRQAFETYLPLIQLPKRRRGKWEEVIEPLFPRYLFLHIDAEVVSVAPIRSTRGVVGLVRFGEMPMSVPDEIIEFLRQSQDPQSGLHHPHQAQFRKDDKVMITHGPFAGLEGIFVAERGADRVLILLDLLGKANRITLSRDVIAPAGE